MNTRSKEESPRRERNGLVSHILLQRGDLSDVGLTATYWVDVAPGSRQRPHEHPSEQVYVITAGSGRMLVGEEERQVGSGNLIDVSPGAVHSIENTSEEMLTYISAATPALDAEAAYDRGQLRSE
jgi:mannose-6-phosphate isomerase-like protein (cupin superfamily)